MHTHWESHGAARGPAVVMIQGLGLSSRFWFDQPALALARGCKRVITLDNRGTGRSDKPFLPYRLPQMADDVARVIREANAGPAVVVGISMGGMIAQHVAMRHPRDVRALVLLATTAGLPHAKLPALSVLRTLLRAPTARDPKSIRAMHRILLPEKEVDRANVHLARWNQEMLENPTLTATFLRQFAAVMTNWTGERVRKIDQPAVVIHGTEDILVPPENAERLAGLISKSELVMLSDIAHAIPLLAPDVIGDALEKVAA